MRDQNTNPSKKIKSSYKLQIYLSEKDRLIFDDLSKTLGMSRVKIVRFMVLDKAEIILCNTVEVLKTLDSLGIAIANMRSTILNSQANSSPKKNEHAVPKIEDIKDEYYDLEIKIENALRELIKLLTKMK